MPELRKDPITERWVIIATDRARRPSDFSRESASAFTAKPCPFCPGNEQKTASEIYSARDGGNWYVRVVPNKFPVLSIDGDTDRDAEGLYDKMNGLGAHEVIIETPIHTETLASMNEAQVEAVIWAWRSRIQDLRNDHRLRYVLLFKNHGEAAGATQEHAHSQLIALPVVPKRVTEELEGSARYYQFKERCIFCDMLRQEAKGKTRVVTEGERMLVIEPFAARFPFETWILPKRHQSHFEALDAAEVRDLARALRSTLHRMHKVLENPAYNFIIHTAPVQEKPMAHYHWHIEIIPKLTKVAGFEWGTGFYINPTPPEEAAEFLRSATVA